MKLRLLLSLSVLGLAAGEGLAQSAADFFHNGAVNYLSNNVPKALEVVTNGRARFPDDLKLKKLEELLKQQSQQQSQQSQQEKQGSQQQQAQDQKQQDQQQQPESKQQDEQQMAEGQQQDEEQPEEQKGEAQPVAPGQMTPEEAKRLLDAQKSEERTLQFRPEAKPRDARRPFKDW
jgi:hypothetical protein